MSKDAKKADPKKPDGAAAEPAKKSKLPLILIIAGVVVLGGGGAAFFLMKGKKPPEGEAAKPAEPAKAAAIHYKFDPSFVVNFGPEGNTRYLQITLDAMTRDPKVVEEMKGAEPAIRNDLVMLYSSQTYESLVSAEGKEKLRADTLAIVRKAITDEGGKPDSIENVYFTSFVIQ